MSSETRNCDYLTLKNEGNVLFSAGDFSGAIQKYSEGLERCFTKNTTDKATLLKNRAAAYLKLGDYQKAIDDSTAALKIIPRDSKALYRRCQAYEQLGKYFEAFEDARAANYFNPKNSAIQPYLQRLQEIVEEANESSAINSLPTEVILKIFSYLRHNQLGQIARVCRKWSLLTRTPMLWKNVSVKFSPLLGSQNTVAENFASRLPPCITRIKIDFNDRLGEIWVEPLIFKNLCVKLHLRCTHLETLFLFDSKFSESLPTVINLCIEFLPDLKNLVVFNSEFTDVLSSKSCVDCSKIEVLDLSGSYFGLFSTRPPFSRMPNLKQLSLSSTNVDDFWFKDYTAFLDKLQILDLGDTNISSSTFEAIRNNGCNLKELYLCSTKFLEDSHLIDSVFPHLETICIKFCKDVTCEGVISLIQSCKSLVNVYVHDSLATSCAEHCFIVANKDKSGIVKVIHCNNHEKLDY